MTAENMLAAIDVLSGSFDVKDCGEAMPSTDSSGGWIYATALSFTVEVTAGTKINASRANTSYCFVVVEPTE